MQGIIFLFAGLAVIIFIFTGPTLFKDWKEKGFPMGIGELFLIVVIALSIGLLTRHVVPVAIIISVITTLMGLFAKKL